MKIINKRKFIRTISMLILILIGLIFWAKATYSNVETSYIEDYIYEGETLWSIASKQLEENRYFEGKDIRFIVEELKSFNNLKTSNVYEGEKIKIPIYK